MTRPRFRTMTDPFAAVFVTTARSGVTAIPCRSGRPRKVGFSMNKKITILILAVVASAMGLVLFSHLMQSPEPVASKDSAALDESLRNLETAPAQPVGREPVFTAQGTSQSPLPTIEPPMSRPGSVQTPPSQPAQPVTQPRPAAPAVQAERPATPPVQRPVPETPARTESRQASNDPPPTSRAPETRETAPSKPSIRPQDLSLTGKHAAKHVGLHFSGQNILLRVEAGKPFPCKTFLLNTPDRLVVDLPGTWQGLSVPSVPQNNVVTGVRLGNQPAGPRMVLDLSRPVKWQVTRPENNVLEIVIQ